MTSPALPFTTLHQVLTGATAGDAITTHAVDIQRWLHALGIRSHIYALHVDDSAAGFVRPLAAYRPRRQEPAVIYHHSIGSEVPDLLLGRPQRLVLVYHNVTPPDFFRHVDPGWVRLARLGQAQLAALQPKTALALAVSEYNRQDLLAAGYAHTAVLPLVLPAAAYDLPSDPALAAELAAAGPFLLFVGRFAPNKKQADLVKLLACVRRIRPDVRLVLVGDPWIVGYDRFTRQLAADLGLADAVALPGKVSPQALVTYYRHAALYVSLSAHEGFGKPLIESMYLGLPVLAYAAGGVAETLGPAGVRLHAKPFEELAELVAILLADAALRQRLAAAGRQRVQAFLEPAVHRQFLAHLHTLAERLAP
ncbi:MAG: glycosyltransferase [Anaerolineales bacterium]|nr:glycosyltransferase [Anaerolineales bacterium]